MSIEQAGWIFEDDHVLVFFGKRHIAKEHIQDLFPQLTLRFIKQTHSDICVAASSEIVEADAHYTSERKSGLLIQTADCLPVLVHNDKSVLAIHAGWRGIENRIIPKSIIALGMNSNARVWIGPHYKSFESHLDVAERLQKAAQSSQNFLHEHTDMEKSYVDLTAIAQEQLLQTGVTSTWISPVDTFNDSDYHSWRRDKASGRQWSLIALK